MALACLDCEQIHPADHRLLSKIVSPKFVKWERLFEPKTPPKEWNQLEMVRLPPRVCVVVCGSVLLTLAAAPGCSG